MGARKTLLAIAFVFRCGRVAVKGAGSSGEPPLWCGTAESNSWKKWGERLQYPPLEEGAASPFVEIQGSCRHVGDDTEISSLDSKWRSCYIRAAVSSKRGRKEAFSCGGTGLSGAH